MNSAAIHQAAQFSTIHAAQLHFYGSIFFGFVFCLIAMIGIVGVARTAHRRTRRGLLSATVSVLGTSLIGSSTVLNAFVAPKPHSSAGIFIPTSGLGAVLFASGLLVIVIGILSMPVGEAGRWLPAQKPPSEERLIDAEVWPPAPKL